MSGLSEFPRVGIVLVNWNRADDTISCIRSLEQVRYASYRVVIVDNGSEDDSPAIIRRHFPDLCLIENRRNLGFAAGSNVGIAELMRSDLDYVMLLNNDTEVAPDFLRIMVEAGEDRADVGVLGPKILYYEPSDVIWSAGGCIDNIARPRHLRVDERDNGSPDRSQDVDYVTGCAMLVKRQVVEQVGMLDERFFMYFEETEWCARARKHGWRITYVPQARVWHKIEQNARSTSRNYQYLMARNRLLYLKCSGARPSTVALASLDALKTAASWSLRPKHRAMRPYSGALVRGVRDFAVGHFGAPPAGL